MRAVPTPFGDVAQSPEDVRERVAAREREPDLAVARQIAGAGQHEIAEPRQPGQRERAAAHPLGEPAHLGQAARDQRGARVVAEAEAVAAADRDRDDVLQRAAQADAGDVVCSCRYAGGRRRSRPARPTRRRRPSTPPPARPAARARSRRRSWARTERRRPRRAGSRRSRRPSSRRVPGSRPFDAQTTTGDGATAPLGGRAPATACIVAATNADGTATTSMSRSATRTPMSLDTATSAGRRNCGTRARAGALARQRIRRGAIDLPQRHVVTVSRCDRGEHASPRTTAQDGDGVLHRHLRPRDADPIAAGVLGREQRAIGGRQDQRRLGAVIGKRGHPERRWSACRSAACCRTRTGTRRPARRSAPRRLSRRPCRRPAG